MPIGWNKVETAVNPGVTVYRLDSKFQINVKSEQMCKFFEMCLVKKSKYIVYQVGKRVLHTYIFIQNPRVATKAVEELGTI